MREIDQRLLARAMAILRKSMPSSDWSAFADLIVADRLDRERHISKPDFEMDRTLSAGLEALRTNGVVVHPLRLEAEKVTAIREHLQRLPVYGGAHIYNSDLRQRSLAEVRQEATLAGYTADQLLRTPYLVDFLNHPAIIDFIQLAIGCVPTLYSINAWWSFPAKTPTGDGSQFFHRDNDDWRFITLFLYLTDVDESSGPHQLIAGSHTLSGVQQILARVQSEAANENAIDARATFSNHFGVEYSASCERLFGDSIMNIEGSAGTMFMANTVAMHRGLMPRKTPRLVVWARYGLGPNTNSVDLEQGPLSRVQVMTDLSDTWRNRYVNRLLFEFDRSPVPTPEIPPGTETNADTSSLARIKELEQELNAMRKSKSWRATRFLRAARKLVRRGS